MLLSYWHFLIWWHFDFCNFKKVFVCLFMVFNANFQLWWISWETLKPSDENSKEFHNRSFTRITNYRVIIRISMFCWKQLILSKFYYMPVICNVVYVFSYLYFILKLFDEIKHVKLLPEFVNVLFLYYVSLIDQWYSTLNNQHWLVISGSWMPLSHQNRF